MKRTQIYLDEEIYAYLKRESKLNAFYFKAVF